MNKEEKELLLKCLSERVPYGVCVEIDSKSVDGKRHTVKLCEVNASEILKNIETLNVQPILRPMSSMTEEEFESLKEYSGLKYEQLDLTSYQNGTHKCLDFYLSEVPSYIVILVFDWLNEHHFDYRGLIERGLAIEAPKGMYT